MLTEYSILSQHIHRIMTQDGPLGVLLPLHNFNIFSSGFYKNHQQQSMLNAHYGDFRQILLQLLFYAMNLKMKMSKNYNVRLFVFRSMQHVDLSSLTILHVQTSFIVYGNIILEFLWLVN